MNRTSFYRKNGKIKLPIPHIYAYVDNRRWYYEQTGDETKLMHLLYVADNGYDILGDIKKYLNKNPDIEEETIKWTMARLISHMRYDDGNPFITDICNMNMMIVENLSLDAILDLLLKEIRLRFSYEDNGLEIIFSQKYLRWPHLSWMEKSIGKDNVIMYVVNPPGYDPEI